MKYLDRQFVAGDQWNIAVDAHLVGMNWSGVEVRCQFRRTPDGAILFETSNGSRSADCDVALYAYLSLDLQTPNHMYFTIQVPGRITANFQAGRNIADIQFYRASDSWGPFTPVTIRVDTLEEITHT